MDLFKCMVIYEINNKARYNVAFQQQESRSIDVELFISVRE